ncbi:MAG: transcription elongation factor GreA [Bacillota bacterium]|nr:transcription elongation factor GreA [Negativicutes bacterium]
MAEKEVFLTVVGLKNLEQELDYLKSVKRREVAERIKQAIEFGDISENSEYDDAKNEQAFIEGKIMELEKKLRNARIIEEGTTDKVSLGSTVVIKDLEFGDVFEYTIVGSTEADPSANRISNESPVGEALIGKIVGSVIEVNVPAGIIKYELVGLKKA